MARKVLDKLNYTFTPSTRTVVLQRHIPIERLVLITNVTTGQVIYNFSDTSLRSASGGYTASVNSSNIETTTIVLNYNTTSMSSTDKLQVIVDEYAEKFEPAETYLDPTNKFRVTQPQALIDTDFEYGTQTSKWENLTMINQRPFAYATATQVANIAGIAMATSARTVTISLSSGTFPANGTSIYVQDTILPIANGAFIIESGGGTASAVYTARATNVSAITAIFDPNRTVVFTGALYSGAQIGAAPTFAVSGQQIQVTTTVPHGLSIGNEIAVAGITGTNPPNGTYIVTTVDSPTVFKYYTPATSLASGLTTTSAAIYNLPQGQVLHRPGDGGVIFSTNSSSNYEQTIRQTRRYFRYQSGKGIQISSGTLLKPSLQLDSLTSVGTTVTAQTKEKHNILPGATVTVSGSTDAPYNGTFTVTNVTAYNKFTYTALSTPASTVGAGGPYYAAVSGWYGASNRLGIFDNQNGLFFEFDGQTLYAVRRNSTFQLSGRMSITNGANTLTQTNAEFPTYFTKELAVGDYIVIRGQSYKVQDILNDTTLTISPSYKGATTTYAIASKTVDTRIPQSSWNLDKCDGTGPSGYNIDVAKMQMFYIDYSWYGAGFIRWGVRGKNGDVVYVHKLANNNINSEAYMRSGNLPARYESTTFPYVTQATAAIGASDSVLSVTSTTGFPPSGTLCIRNGVAQEYVNYTSTSASAFSGLTRAKAGYTTAQTLTVNVGSTTATIASATNLQIGQRIVSASIPEGTYIVNLVGTTITMSNAATAATATDVLFPPMGATSGQVFPFNSSSALVGVELAYPNFAPTISHWGTSVIMDGRYDDDKSLIFTYGQNAGTILSPTATAQSRKALFAIRVAPSVDNGTPAAFGARELINRMQLVLRALDITTSTANSNLLVTAVLNGVSSSAVPWTNAVNNSTTIANSSLAQLANYAGGNVIISGGEVTGGFFVSNTTSIDLNTVRDLGNSVLGGGAANSNTQVYPDGPDVLTIVVENLGSASATIFGRLSWTEAQA
jgi:hypothetical protein